MLALSFLLLIGTTLVANGVRFHVPKGYVYAAIGFSIGEATQVCEVIPLPLRIRRQCLARP